MENFQPPLTAPAVNGIVTTELTVLMVNKIFNSTDFNVLFQY